MKNRLQWLYDEYMSETENQEKETCEHQKYMSNLISEMSGLINVMNADLEHIILLKPEHRKKREHKIKDKLQEALSTNNWKWAMYELLKDEVHDAEKYLTLFDLAVSNNKTDWATQFKMIANQEIHHAEMINSMYISIPYTHGTKMEQEKWDLDYNNIIKQHSKNIEK